MYWTKPEVAEEENTETLDFTGTFVSYKFPGFVLDNFLKVAAMYSKCSFFEMVM